MARNKPEYIIIHHSLSHWGCKRAIDRWHKRRGFGVRVKNRKIHIGYHYVINNGYPTYKSLKEGYQVEWDGKIEKARPNLVNGAHCKQERMNYRSLGICLVGNFDLVVPTQNQLRSLYELCALLCRAYSIPLRKIAFHRDFAPHKSCPGSKFPPLFAIRAGVRKTLVRAR